MGRRGWRRGGGWALLEPSDAAFGEFGTVGDAEQAEDVDRSALGLFDPARAFDSPGAVVAVVGDENVEVVVGDGGGGLGGAQAGGAIQINNNSITASYTIATGQNGFSVGPITIASGYTVTVSNGQRWVVL